MDQRTGCIDESLEELTVAGENLGRSREGLSIKIHLAVDGRDRPMRILLTPGQAGDNPQLLPLLDNISVGRVGPGRPEVVILDSATWSNAASTGSQTVRDLTTRNAKRTAYYHAGRTIAAIILWLR